MGGVLKRVWARGLTFLFYRMTTTTTTKLEMLCPVLILCVFALMRLCETVGMPVEASYFRGVAQCSVFWVGLYAFFVRESTTEELTEVGEPPIEDCDDDEEPADSSPAPAPVPFDLRRFELDLYARQTNAARDNKFRRAYAPTLGPKVNIGYHRF